MHLWDLKNLNVQSWFMKVILLIHFFKEKTILIVSLIFIKKIEFFKIPVLPWCPNVSNLVFFEDGIPLGDKDLLPFLEASLSDEPAVEKWKDFIIILWISSLIYYGSSGVRQIYFWIIGPRVAFCQKLRNKNSETYKWRAFIGYSINCMKKKVRKMVMYLPRMLMC